MGRGSQQKSDSPLHVSLRATREQVLYENETTEIVAFKGRAGDREPVGTASQGGFGWIGVPVKRHRGEPGHTWDTRDTRADKKTPGGAGTHVPIQ